jgi:uncharacterized membrane protein
LISLLIKGGRKNMADFSDLAGVGIGGMGVGELGVGILLLIVVVMIWKLIWYGMALYRTIERKQMGWFTVLFVAAFVLGDVGILAIIYLLIYKKPSRKPTAGKAKKKKK